MKNHVNHYCSKMALCKSPACHPLRSSCRSWKGCPNRLSYFLRDPLNNSQIRSLKSTLQRRVSYTLHLTWPQSSMVLQDERQGHLMSGKRETSLHGNSVLRTCVEICAVWAVYHCAGWRSVPKTRIRRFLNFKIPSSVSGSPGPPLA